MKRKFDETCASSYTEARNLVFNISLGKLNSNSPKPVEPSLWRSLLIVKTLHRIAEELKTEASSASEAATADKVIEDVLEDQQLDALFLLQTPPVAILLSDSEEPNSSESISDDCAMQMNDADEQSSSIILGTCASLNSDTMGSPVPFRTGGNAADSCAVSHCSLDGAAVTGVSSAQDNFDEIDCECLESFQSVDLSDISISLDRDFLLGSQMPLSFSAFSSPYEDIQGFGSISDLDCLMQVLEEECV